jgi:hypothetical protein
LDDSGNYILTGTSMVRATELCRLGALACQQHLSEHHSIGECSLLCSKRLLRTTADSADKTCCSRRSVALSELVAFAAAPTEQDIEPSHPSPIAASAAVFVPPSCRPAPLLQALPRIACCLAHSARPF